MQLFFKRVLTYISNISSRFRSRPPSSSFGSAKRTNWLDVGRIIAGSVVIDGANAAAAPMRSVMVAADFITMEGGIIVGTDSNAVPAEAEAELCGVVSLLLLLCCDVEFDAKLLQAT